MDDSLSLYLYFSYTEKGRPDGYSLYSVDISLPGEDKGCEGKQPQLVVRIHITERDSMACAKLGTKFYFLGGLTLPNEGNDAHFPTDVWVYDPADPNNSNKEPDSRVTQGEPMNFGKSHPITFEVNGKLYVLGESNPYGGHKRLENLFEEYDPIKNCWKLLEGPPLEDIPSGILRVHQSFVVSSNRVLITGNFGGFIFSFDPLNYKWKKLPKIGGFDSRSIFVKDSIYGVWEDGGLVTKLGPSSSFKDEEEIDATNTTELRIEWGCFSPSSKLYIYPTVATRAICHLGGRIFCAITTGPGRAENPRVLDYVPDYHLRLLNLIIYEEIPGEPSSSMLKCIQQAPFPIRTKFSSFGSLTSCYVITAEKDKRIPVDEKKIKTNLEEKDKMIQVDKNEIKMYQEEKDKMIQVDENEIKTYQEKKDKIIQVDENEIKTYLEKKDKMIQVDENEIKTYLEEKKKKKKKKKKKTNQSQFKLKWYDLVLYLIMQLSSRVIGLKVNNSRLCEKYSKNISSGKMYSRN